MSQTNALIDLERRVRDLETHLARQRLTAIVLVAIVLGSGLLFGQDRTRERIRGLGIEGRITALDQIQPPLVVRDSISIVGPGGEERAVLTATLDGSSLVLFDSEGDVRVGIDAGYSTSVTLYDEELRTRAILGATPMVPSHVESSDGSIERVPVSSLVLFKDDGGVLERMP